MLVVYIFDLSGFERVCEEDEVTNRWREQLLLFETILDYVYFQTTNFIVLLNKTDVLKERLEAGAKISQYLPEFQFVGPDGHYETAIEFFKEEIMSKNEDADETDRQLFIHEISCVDEQNVRECDTVIQSIILDEILKNSV